MHIHGEKQRVTLVVGTTPDYIEWIRTVEPEKNIFLTDSLIRQRAKESSPDAKEEILCDLADYQTAGACLERHLACRGLVLDGITCFDCESMELAAILAEQYSLPYPSRESIGLCRNKYLCKLKWQEAGLDCPKTRRIYSPDDTESFFAEHKGRMVLKPLTGAGSEHVYLCNSSVEARTSYGLILSAMERKGSDRLYGPSGSPNELVVAEELIDGEEYSCDFIIDNTQIRPVRLTKKLHAVNRPFGTIHGYVLCNSLPEKISEEIFFETLRQSALSLRIDYGICMLDFIVRDNKMVLLEIAPRPGGDCLPYLLLKARGIDMLKLSLDFARQKHSAPAVFFDNSAPVFMGMKIIAEKGGVLREVDASAIKTDKRVIETGLSHEPGHTVVMPPEDYNSWILGHIIVMLEYDQDPLEQLTGIDEKITIVMDTD
jgi:predicted ATP-grasp superfamily ATP-dependent carboligase